MVRVEWILQQVPELSFESGYLNATLRIVRKADSTLLFYYLLEQCTPATQEVILRRLRNIRYKLHYGLAKLVADILTEQQVVLEVNELLNTPIDELSPSPFLRLVLLHPSIDREQLIMEIMSYLIGSIDPDESGDSTMDQWSKWGYY
jgi:hypothetical protein